MVDAILDPVGARVVERACSSTQAVLAGVNETDLDRPSPCASWTVSRVIRHVVGGAAYFAELAEAGEVADDDDDEEADKPIGDFNGAFSRSAERLVAAYDAPGALDKILKMPIGDIPASVGVWIATGDIFIHGWDLAKATGQTTDLDPDLAETLLRRLSTMLPDSMRGLDGEAPFGPKVDVPSSAPSADRLAGYMGRTP